MIASKLLKLFCLMHYYLSAANMHFMTKLKYIHKMYTIFRSNCQSLSGFLYIVMSHHGVIRKPFNWFRTMWLLNFPFKKMEEFLRESTSCPTFVSWTRYCKDVKKGCFILWRGFRPLQGILSRQRYYSNKSSRGFYFTREN